MPQTPPSTKIAIGSDHGGFALKKDLRKYLEDTGSVVEDVGTFSTDSVDYPRFAHAVALRVASGRCDFGIVIDGAGIGSAMAANKVPGIRAALCYDLSSARNGREHNNANVLTLGAGLIGPGLARQIVRVFLETACTEQRHLRRADMIEDVAGSETVSPSQPSDPPQSRPNGPSQQGAEVPTPADTPDADMSDSDIQRIIQRISSIIGPMPSGPGAAAAPTNQCTCMMCSHTGNADPDLVRKFIGIGADRIGHRPANGQIPRDIAKYIDHTLLRPDATRDQIVQLCAEARQYEFASVCVNPNWTSLCARQLKGSPVKVCTVAGFPLGAHAPEIKAAEARRSVRDGASEIDMVINVGALKSGDDDLVRKDIAAVVEACHDGRATCKVIIEAALLNDEEKVRACKLAKKARADYVKTSTGFGPGGATAHDVALMCETVCPAGIGVKAAGGIRSYADAKKMIEAGATRLGASAGIKIVQQAREVTLSA